VRVTMVATGAVSAAHLPMYLSWLRRREAHGLERIVMTRSASHFVSPLSLRSIAGVPVIQDDWESFSTADLHHVELGESTDVILVYPATVNYLMRVSLLAFDTPSVAAIATGACTTVLCPSLPPRIVAHPLYTAARHRIESVPQYRMVEPVVGESLASTAPGSVPPPLWELWPELEGMVTQP
jgi:phosphopantothenoylcysteine synthetase/decarboxylase